MEDLDFSELSQLEAEEFTQVAAEREITLIPQIQEGIHLTGDQTLLLRLWGNLLQNAVTYGKRDGHIWMTLSRQGDQVQLSVRDDGIGIAPEDLPRIWDRFYQADPSRTSDNSGLGLSMVRWIAQAHGGDVTAESTLGEGSRFTVTLPVRQP